MTAIATLDVTVVDDVPTAENNVRVTTEGHGRIQGNVITNVDATHGKDVAGADGSKLYHIRYNDVNGTTQDYYFNDSNWHIFQTKTGKLEIRQTGQWRFTPVADYDHDDDPNGVGNQKNNAWDGSFRYWLVDGDGDISNRATMRIDVRDTKARMRPESGGIIDEDDLPNGSDGNDSTSVTKGLGIAPGADPIEDIRFVQSDVDAFVQKYKSDGQVLSAKLEDNDHKLVAYITEANGFEKSIFEVTINPDTANYANSTYTFELKDHLDHPNGHGQNKLNMSIPFQLVEQDDYVNAKAKLKVRDDVPTPVDDTDQTITEGSTAVLSGNVLDNDILGADGAMLRRIRYITKGGNERNAFFSDTHTEVTVNTPTGKLTVHRNGLWEFDPNTKVDHDDPIQGTPGSPDMSWQGSFRYELIDSDRDKAIWGHQQIGVADGTDPSAADVNAAVDEDDIPNIGSDGAQSNVVSGNFSVTGGSDPVEKVVFTTTGSGTLTSDGVAIDYSWDDATKTLTGTAGGNTIFTAEVTGTVNNPGYKFTLLGPIDHAAPASGADQNTIVVPLEYQATDWDGDAATAKLNVTVTDDIPSIGTPQNGEVFESGLTDGAHPGDPAYPVEATGSLKVGKEADRFETYFTDDATDPNSTTGSLLAQGITAEGKALSYTVSADGHTLTGLIDAGSANEKTVFTVVITDPDSDNASYTFDLLEAIDNNDTAPTDLGIKFTVKDADEDETHGSFDVKINDDEGQTQVNIVLDEDDPGYGFYVTADKIQSLDSDDAAHGSVTLDAANNKLVYTPDANYSGKDRSDGTDYFTVTYTTTDGVTHSTKVYTVVDPVSDAPTLSVDGVTVNTDEDTAVALGLNAPQLVDTTDQNGSGVDGDWPERLGVVTLDGIPSGAKLLDSSGNTLTTSSGSAITILISDLPHVNGTTADLTMTKTEFEALKVDPVAQSGDNFTVTMKASSYEVDGNGNIIDDHSGNPVAGAESTTQVTVDVQAVTDPLPDPTKVKDAHGDEDGWIRVDDTFTVNPTVDRDGSEHYTVTFDGTNLPAGTRYFVGPNPSGNGQDASGGFTVTIPNSGVPSVPEIYIKTPDNDSADIDSLKVTVAVTDTDGDSSGSITTNSKDLTIDVDVDPVANDIALTTDPSSGDEDTLIPLNLHFTVTDTQSVPGNETVTSVTIADIPDGAKIYKADGTTLVYENNTGGLASTTITIDASTSIGDVEGFKILPPGHSSTDFTLKVSATTQDIDDGGGQATATGAIAPVDVLVEVASVAETNTDTNQDGNTDVTLNPDHTYATHAVEDTWFDLNAADAGFALLASNEDDKNSGNPYASEETWVEFHSVRDSAGNILADAQIMYNNGSIDIVKTLNAPVQVPIEYLNTVKFKAPDNYSGTVKVDMTLGTLDHDEDAPNSTNGPVNSLTSTLQVDVDPATDPINVAITQSNGLEDAGRNPDGTIDASSAINGIVLNSRVASLDPDGSEHINVFIDDIPEDAAIYYDIDGDGTREIITANSDFGQVNEAPQGQTGPIDVVQYDTANHTWKLLIQNYDEIQVNDRPIIIPPHNSNIDIVLKASGYAVDTTTFSDGSSRTDTGAESAPYNVNVFIEGVADEAVNNEIYLQDIDTSVDPNTHDLTVTLDPNKSGKYSAVAEEDSGTTHTTGNTDTFVEFDLKSIFKTPDRIDSYDNLKTNDPDQNPVDTTVTDPNAAPDDIASESLTVTIENLGADFDVTGATLVGGTGSSRIWATSAADIDAGNVKIRTLNEHFSGEINFDLRYNTTEDDGDTDSSTTQNVSLLVTPEAEGLAGVLQTTTDVREDVLTHMTFSTTTTLPDSDEYVSALGIARDDYTIANGQSFKGIENADFTIYLGNGSGKQTIQDVAADPNDHRVELVEDNGVWFYKIADPADWNDLYVLYNADIGGKEDPNSVGTAHQTDFGFKFDVTDKTQAVQSGTTVDLIDTKSGFQESANYTFNLTPVTDDITADAKDGDITDADGDGTTDIAVSGHDITISAPTIIDVKVTIEGVDTQNENGTGPNGTNGLDIDGSEQIRSIRIEGVPDGIGIVGGHYVGDTVDPATGLPTGNNTWLVDLNQNPIVMDAATKTYNLQFEVSGNYINAASDTSDVKISFINQEYDSTLSTATPQSTAQTGDFTLTFHRDPNFGGSTNDAPMDIIGVTDVNGDGVVDEKDGYTVDPNFDTNPTDPYQGGFKEDTTTKLGDIIHLDINDVQGSTNAELGETINSDLFSITVEGLDPNIVDVSAGGQPIHSGVVTGWRYEHVNGTDILTYRGSGDKSAIEAALNALEITPKQDLNHNNINFIGQDDITFTTTLTTYTQSGVKDVVSTDFSGNIEPVTDKITVTDSISYVDKNGNTVSGSAGEDILSHINLNIDSVDNPYLEGGSVQSVVLKYEGVTSGPDFQVTLGATGIDANGDPIGSTTLNVGDTYSLTSAQFSDLTFLAAKHESGQVNFSYTVVSKEQHAQNTETTTGDMTIDIDPIADGLDTGGGNPKAEGKEDEFIQVIDANGNPFSGDLIDNATNNTTPETLKTVILGDVPPGWLVYYDDGSGKTLAQNLGTNGGANNYWNIPLGSGANPVPEIFVKAPAQVGGITAQFQLISGVEDGGRQVYASVPIDVSVLSVADPITMNPSPTGGVEGEKIPLNFNTVSADVDGSERYEVKLTGLGENAVFYFQGTELGSGVSYDRSADTYTISDAVGINHDSIDKLTVTQNDFSGTVDAEIVVHDAVPNDGTTQSASASFAMNISQQQATSADNTLLYDKHGVDGLGGDDTVIFGTDWDGFYDGVNHTIDLSALANIEKFDLTQHGDHHLVMSAAEVTAMTDARNALSIDADTGDTVVLKDEGDNIWLQNGNDFTNIADGTKVTVNDPGLVSIERATPTGGDDIIGFDGQNIDAGAGDDRIVALDGIGIDFSKLQNIETLDLSKSGDHDLGTLSLNDVVNMTDGNDTLTIEGDDTNDKVTLTGGDWDSHSSAGGYTTYVHNGDGTNTDPTVTLKIDDDITVTVA